MSEKANEGALTTEKVSALDKAINAAKQRKAARNGEAPAAKAPKAEKASKPEAEPKRPRLTDEEKAARTAAKEQERATKKASRDAAREAKRIEREAGKQPAHLRKVMKAAEKLTPLAQAAQLLFNEATANLTAADLAQLALHIQQFNREAATKRALGAKLEQGMRVTIVSGDHRYIGQQGTVTKAQRIRCYVKVEGAKKDVYLFTSDVEPVAAEAAAE